MIFTIKPLHWTACGRNYHRAHGCNQYSYAVKTDKVTAAVTLIIWHAGEPVAKSLGGTVEEAKRRAEDHHREKLKRFLAEATDLVLYENLRRMCEDEWTRSGK